MYCVGKPSTVARQLIDTTYEAMVAGIRQVKPGATLGDVGYAIQKIAQRDGFSIVRDYCGHGIGKVYHEDPQVLHYGQPGQGVRLKPGMVFTIEPMINAGRAGTTVQRDGWTVVTKDRSLSAQWEHMVAVTEDGFELLDAMAGRHRRLRSALNTWPARLRNRRFKAVGVPIAALLARGSWSLDLRCGLIQ